MNQSIKQKTRTLPHIEIAVCESIHNSGNQIQELQDAMSKLNDYSKFDNLKEDSDDENHTGSNDDAKKDDLSSRATAAVTGSFIRRDEVSGRYRFEYNGNTIYEFEQSLDDVTIYILPPPFVTKGRQINCIISANHFRLGLVGQDGWFLNEATFGTVDVDESTWTLEDYDGDGDEGNKDGNKNRKIIVVVLTKANRGLIWDAALKGNPNAVGATNKEIGSNRDVAPITIDPVSKEQVKKDLLLQRFQEENPGFDFSGADFNGSVPDARKFMGGVKYQ